MGIYVDFQWNCCQFDIIQENFNSIFCSSMLECVYIRNESSDSFLTKRQYEISCWKRFGTMLIKMELYHGYRTN